MLKRPQRHSTIKDIEHARVRSKERNQEHNFYKTALHCQMPQNIRSKMVYGFKVSQGLRSSHKRQTDGQILILDEGANMRKRNASTGQQPSKQDLRYSLKQYEDLIVHTWKTQLDTEQKQEVTEGKFFRFLRDNKILTEKKQLDEMYKQCLFIKKGEEISVSQSVSYAFYQRLF